MKNNDVYSLHTYRSKYFSIPHTVKCLRSMYHKKKIRYLEHKLEGPKKHRTAKNRSIVWNFGEWI